MKLRSLFVGMALVLPLTVTMAQPAAAAYVDVAVITGSGTISPGLTPTVQSQSISFDGTATIVGTDGVLATYNCSFSGTGFGNMLGGTGEVSGSCGPVVFPSCTFVFTTVNVVVACPVNVGLGGGDCIFTPANINPTTSYSLVCASFLIQVP